jgi:peptidoglycan/LPS O-acetylase OafA/YrhL
VCNCKWLNSGAEIIIILFIFITAKIYSSQTILIGQNWCRYSILWIPTSMAIVWLFAEKKGIVSKLFTNKFFIWIGNISSFTFLIHEMVIIYGNNALNKSIGPRIALFLNKYIASDFGKDYLYKLIAAIICLTATVLLSEIWRRLPNLKNRKEIRN